MAIAETSIKSAETLQTLPTPRPNDSAYQPPLRDTQLPHLQVLVREKASLIKKLTEENQYLHVQIKQLEERIESEIKQSDAMLEQMQAASEKSDKHAQAIIIHLSQQAAQQAEQIEILQELQGFSGAIRQTARQLKSRILRERLAAGSKYGYEA
jgi:ribosomal protein S20